MQEMSRFQFVQTALRSRVIREIVTGDPDGSRIIGDDNSDKSLIDRFKDIGGLIIKSTGSILKFLGFVGFSILGLVNWMIQGVNYAWNFNWNITDEQIDQQFNNIKLRLVGQLGGTLGNAVGWLVCGAGPGLLMLKFNKAMALHVLKEVGEEGLEELAANLALLARQSTRGLISWLAMTAFKNTRRFIKDAARDPNSFTSIVGSQIFGSNFNNMVQAWGEEGSKPWSFAIAFNNWIESIENPYIQEFTEEFFDEAFDACQEALYVVANGMEQYLLEQRLANEQLLGSERVVEILPNREADREGAERIIIGGPEQLVRSNVVATMNMYQLLDNRDVGQIIAQDIPETVKKAEWETSLTILWRGVESPPWGSSKRAQCTILDVKRSKLDWALIKQLAGGNNGRMWGRFKVKASTNVGEPTLYAATPEGGSTDLENLILGLSGQEIYSIEPIEETKKGKRLQYQSLYKQPTRVYPASMTIINKQKVLNEVDGRAEYSGVYKERRYVIPLWPSTQPLEWDLMINEIFTVKGVTP